MVSPYLTYDILFLFSLECTYEYIHKDFNFRGKCLTCYL